MVKKRKAAPRTVNILGQKVVATDLKRSLQEVLKTRGMSGDLILEKPMTAQEEIRVRNEDFQYANVYKYAFF